MTTQSDPLVDTLREAFAEDVAESSDDAALIARAISGATKRLDEERPAPVARLDDRTRAPRASRRWLRVAIPLAAAFAASLAMAAFVASRDAPHEAPAIAEHPAAAPVGTPAKGASGPSAPAPDSTPTMAVGDLPNARVAAPSARVETSTATPAELFRDANQERRSGDVTKAIALYRTLVERHPGSAEAQASHVSLGRLLLDRQGDARGALAEFDAYLKGGANDGALAEEARLGRAVALQRLGRTAEERRAWEELVAHHPQSLHAARARERIEALGTP